ncbi:hypothetical protein FK178_15020 [Antarcticibacterium arcticum]|uniref:Insecticide toxin TcdB middle/N-terminal domain-containing protein n=1 Tax=Antarcticibacterium arcticum TaxID=2585771 RepID=A0A5B8YNX7_9FLAO|nr:FG-GAP-like repeat-containing protein [Antarcticibacterium arcticum]QED38948.1 hypothetical protein FK178_15020 [Antarcticibacterium arcticum]
MKIKILCSIFFFNLLFVFGQQGVNPLDEFTYRTIKVTNVTKDSIPLTGATGTFSTSQESGTMSISGGANPDIGETMGELSVSLTGGATYNIPIAVPPGINGIEPTISISYNSQGGNGLAGYGWNIAGVSVITRIPSTKFHDGNIDAVDFNNLDRFSFDGQRLVLKSGTYGASGAQYETENYSNVKIISYGTSPYGTAYGPSYFIVYYPDGSTARYGSTTDSRSRTDYAISYWENPQGVRISYQYVLQDNSLRINKILYGSRSTAAAINEIQFVYATRQRPEQAYVGSYTFMRKTILKEIRVLGNGVGFRNYFLNHTNATKLGYDRLTSIQEKSGDNSLAHSPVNFNYNTSSTSVNYTGITTDVGIGNIEQRNAEVVSLDLSGNGKMDFIVYPKSASQKNKFWILKDLQSGGFNYPVEVNSGAFEALVPISWLTHNNKILSGQGIGVIQNAPNNEVKFKVYSNGTTNPIYYQYEKVWNAPTYTDKSSCYDEDIQYRIPQTYISGDFNGDGLSDVLAIGKPYSYSSCYETLPNPGEPCGFLEPYSLNTANKPQKDKPVKDPPGQASKDTLTGPILESSQVESTNSSCCQCDFYSNNSSRVHLINLDRRLTTGFASSIGNLSLALQSSHKLLTADVNGDGKTDILQFTPGKVYAYTISNSGYLQLLWSTTDTRIKTEMHPMLGDYNGDGKTDFIVPTANDSYTFAVFLSTGTAFVKTEVTYPFQYKETLWNSTSATLYGYNLIAVDINGDGRTDILDYRTTTYNSSSNGSQNIKVYNNTSSSAVAVTPAFSYGGTVTKSGDLKHFPIPVFLTSDKPNLNLDFASISNNWISSFNFTMDHREDVLLRSISNNGVNHTIKYNNLNPEEYGLDYTSVYRAGYLETYPYVDISLAPGFKVVSSLQRSYSNTPTLKQTFSYYGAVSNIDGLGFLGFQGVARSNWHTGTGDRMYNVSKHDLKLRGAVTSDYLATYIDFNNIPSGWITKNTYTYDPPVLATNKTFTLNLNSKSSSSSLEGTTTTTNYLYDTYNNPKQVKTFYSGNGSETVDITYDDNPGANYYIGRPSKKIETMVVGSNTFSTEEQYTYTGSLITQKKFKGNGTQYDTENYVYDVFGNILKKTTSPYNTAAREANFEYDTSGRFLTKATDALGMATIYTYNSTSGMLATEKNPYNQTTSYFYDSWNRLVKATDYLGKNVLTTFSEASYFYTVTVYADDGTSKISVFDPLKRMTLIKEKDVLGQWVQKSYEYDKFDRPYKESEPYIGSAPSQWNLTEYDFYGRPSKHTSFTGKVTTFTYSNLSVTVNDGTKAVTTLKDAMGNVINVTDPGGTINYTYYGNGAMKTANYDGIVVSVDQDGWGRKTKLTDPSAGVYNYEYNGFGELIKETTPTGNTVYTYTSLGELQQKKVTGDNNTNMTFNYSYDATSKLLTSLKLINADGNNSDYIYSYDSHKRPLSILESNLYANFTKRYTYDDFGRISTEESQANAYGKSSIKKTKNTYQNGGLVSISDFGTNEVLWTLNEINARGQVTLSTVGNNLKKTNTYNTYGYLTEAKTEKASGTTLTQLMQLTFNFNAQRGTLTSRTNSLFSWSENFTYDGLDRLTNFDDNNSQRSHSYDSRGRITTNSAIGDYVYTSTSYRQTELNLNPAGETYFNNYQKQQISYNAFKSPVEITEEGKDKVSFEYNAFLGRANMFYGGLETDKTLRKSRKHYSHDGSMEVAYDKTTGKVTFVTYLMGDAYSSPVIWHSEHIGSTTANNFFYLHRDYLGSILGITDKEGVFKEKRHFDAWGNIVKLTDGNNVALTKFAILDMGYTGHEHLLGVGIIHMNGRLYDPVLHRFLSPDNFVTDPYNTQNYNRYAYVLNNPFMYTDPSGEEPFFIVLATILSVGIIIANAIWGDHDATPYQNTSNNYIPSPTSSGNSSNIASGSPRGTVIASEFDMPHFVKIPSWFPEVNLSRIASSLVPNERRLNTFGYNSNHQDPLKKYKDRAISLEKWQDIYRDKSWQEIATEGGWKQGQPLGPTHRYVINPIDGNVMDMRHVVIVGYGYGENVGSIIEHVQNIHPSTRASAYDPQDYYSNKVGANFFQLRHTGNWSSNSWAYDFKRFIYTHYKTLFNNYKS